MKEAINSSDSSSPFSMRGGVLESVLSASSYAVSAFAIIMFNKVVLSTYKFRSPVFMTWTHMCVSLFFVVLLKRRGWVDYPDFQWSTLRKMVPLSVCFVSNIVLGLLSTKLVSVPVMTTLRRLTALVIIPLEYFVLLKQPKLASVLPVLIMLLGALITGFGDLYFDPLGYSVVLLNDFATAGYLVFTNKAGNDDLGKFGTLFYNTLLSCPLLFFICLFFDEFSYVRNFEYLDDPFFRVSFMCSAGLAFFVNLTTVWCAQANSALTTSVTGQMKNILTTVAGMVLFSDFKPNILANFGIFVSICGSVYYAYEKWRASQAKKVVDTPEPEREETQTFIARKNSPKLQAARPT